MIINQCNDSIYDCSSLGIGVRGLYTRKDAKKGGRTSRGEVDALNQENVRQQHVEVEAQEADEGSNCDEQSYDDEQENEVSSQSSEVGEISQDKMPFSKLRRSPVRWSDLHKQKRAVSPFSSTHSGKQQWKATLGLFSHLKAD